MSAAHSRSLAAAAVAAALWLQGCNNGGASAEEPALPPTGPGCSDRGTNCKDTGCCAEAALQCFQKDDYWASCSSDCVRGVHADDPPEFQTPWSCTVLQQIPEQQLPERGAGSSASEGASVDGVDALSSGARPATAEPAAARKAIAPPPPSRDAPVTSGEQCIRGITKGVLNMQGVSGGAYAAGYGGNVSSDALTLEHNAGFSILSECVDSWTPESFNRLAFAGKTFSFRVDLSRVGCACNLALYLIATPGLDEFGVPNPGQDGDFYCDANEVGGQWCPEVDIMEANTHAFQATPHICDPPNEKGHYANCDRGGCGLNTRDMPGSYGPGASFTIDTTKEFEVHTSFPMEDGVVMAQRTVLQQGERQLSLDNNDCRDSLAGLTEVLSAGMVLRITYWGDSAETMAWMDQPPCGEEVCSGDNTGEATISGIYFTDIGASPDQPPIVPAASSPPPTTPAATADGTSMEAPAHAPASSPTPRPEETPAPAPIAVVDPTDVGDRGEADVEASAPSWHVVSDVCSWQGEDCRETLCCRSPGEQCFQKNWNFATCLPSCEPGIHGSDPPSLRTRWTCVPLSPASSYSRKSDAPQMDGIWIALLVAAFASVAAVLVVRGATRPSELPAAALQPSDRPPPSPISLFRSAWAQSGDGLPASHASLPGSPGGTFVPAVHRMPQRHPMRSPRSPTRSSHRPLPGYPRQDMRTRL